jgi:ppGpp synthetase/RelA/SpoT-type nucleotidyltranferase
LSEYKRFKNLKCEIQLTLILDHAWAEVEHDILYKTSSKIKKLDSNYYEHLKIRMENVMSQHLKQASFELESILSEVKKIKNPKK